MLEFALSQIWKYKDSESNNYFHYYIGYPLKKSIYPKWIFSEYFLIDFETIQLKVPKGVREYLTIMFGDYMKLPNLDQIKWHQHSMKWSPNLSFEKKGKGTFEAERYLW